MPMQVIVGAGPIGKATALLLADQGHEVRLLTRSGGGPEHANIERVAVDASDADALSRQTKGAAALYSCGGPAYHRWATDWPPLGAALIQAAEASGAVLVTTGNLYPYGAVEGPMTEQVPDRPNSVKGAVRARVWADALQAHRAGRIRTAEVRGSDYLGAGAVSVFTSIVLPAVLAGKRASVPADLDAPHSWTDTIDVARTLIAVAADENAWGRVWHVPTAPPLSVRALATRTAELAGAPAARLSRMPGAVLWLGGLFNKDAKEIRETQYQLQRPFVLDSSAATLAFGIQPTPTDDALLATINAARARVA
jgi:nucleoside-diphosphate-sugar epimerase